MRKFKKLQNILEKTGKPEYIEEVTKSIEVQELNNGTETDDDLYNEAVEFVVETRRHLFHQSKENSELAITGLLD